jgi:hypothetical protein
MSIDENKAIVRRYFEDAPYNPTACDEIFAPKVQWHALYHTANPDFESTPQIEKAAYQRHIKIWGDWLEVIEMMIAEGDLVMVYCKGQGRQQAEYLGLPASNRQVTLSIVYIFRIAHGRIVEVWNMGDQVGEWQQLGILPETKEFIAQARETILRDQNG